MKGRAIWEAYADVDMSQPCPECGAAPKAWCTNPITGRVRRIPCMERPLRTSPYPNPIDPPEDQNATDTRDFSEPIHPERTTE